MAEGADQRPVPMACKVCQSHPMRVPANHCMDLHAPGACYVLKSALSELVARTIIGEVDIRLDTFPKVLRDDKFMASGSSI